MRENKLLMLIASAIIVATALFASSSAIAQNSGTCGDNATWTYDENTKTLTISGTGAMSDYVLTNNSSSTPWKDFDDIQTVIIENGITYIGSFSFTYFTNITTVTIPNTVTTIGKTAFGGCSSLTTINIPESVTTIGQTAFRYCTSLSITVPATTAIEGKTTFQQVESLEYHGTSTQPDGHLAWGACSFNGSSFIFADEEKTILHAYIGKGGDIVVPEGVTTLGIDDNIIVFGLLNYQVPTTITLPESLTLIKANAITTYGNIDDYGENLKGIYFKNDPNNLEWPSISMGLFFTVPCYVSSQTFDIWQEKFGDYEQRGFVFVPNGVEFEQDGVVYILSEDGSASVKSHTASLPNELVIPSAITKDGVNYRVTNIFRNAFTDCANLTSVIIPEGVTKIKRRTFYECYNLTSVTIPEGVTDIEREAFNDCKLPSVTIPESTKSIGAAAFYPNTSEVYCHADPDELIIDNDAAFLSNTKFHVPAETLDKFNEKYGNNYTFVGDVTNIAANGITIEPQTYTGSALTPVVKDGEKTLVEGEDYTITIPQGGCTNAGEYTVTLTGKKLYYKSAEKTFTITAKTLVSSNIADIAAQTYTGTAFEPEVTVTDGTKTLVEGTDYTVEYSNNINAGTSAKVIVKGKGNYTETAEKAFTINAKTLVANNVSNLAAQTYTGSAFEPEISVTDGTKTLVEGTDYTVEYSNNTNAGTSAKATITGKGNYTGMVEKTFTINAKTLVASNVSNIAAQTYTGSAIEPDIDVTDGKTTLVKGVDFTVTCSENINVGTATAIITGKGNYAGTVEKTFTITQATPTYTIPENLSLKCNQNLADIILPKGFAFDDINAELTLGKTITVTATFTPEDTKNYVAVKGIEIKVAVADHIHADAVKENEVAATTENAGKYDEVVYCSVCHKELSRTPKTTPQLTHDNPNNQDNPSTPVSSISDNPVVKVWSFNHTIYIETLPDTEYKIIDLNGRVITTSKTKSTNEQIKINQSGILIVIIDNQSFKLSL